MGGNGPYGSIFPTKARVPCCSFGGNTPRNNSTYDLDFSETKKKYYLIQVHHITQYEFGILSVPLVCKRGSNALI